MKEKYSSLDEIPEQVIKDAFVNTNSVRFWARNYNHIQYQSIGLDGLAFPVPLTSIFPLMGITPQMLRPVFTPQLKTVNKTVKRKVKRRFPFNLKWFGLNKNQYENRSEITSELTEVELPKRIYDYESLGGFPINKKRFQELAKILNKPVKVIYKTFGAGHMQEVHPLFIAHPSGKIVDIAKV